MATFYETKEGAFALDSAGKQYLDTDGRFCIAKPWIFCTGGWFGLYCVIGVGRLGGTLWKVQLDGGASAFDVVVDSSRNVFIAGASAIRTVWKLDSSGNELMSFETGAVAFAIALDSSGNIYVGSYRNSDGDNLFKYNSSGTKQWGENVPVYAQVTGVEVDGSGNVFCVGDWDTGTQENLWKYNSSGVQQWGVQTGSSSGHNNALALDSAGDVYPAGGRNGGESIWKYNASGIKQWGADAGPDANAIIVSSSNDVYAAGSENTAEEGIWKFNSSGSEQWALVTKTSGRSLAFDASENIYALLFSPPILKKLIVLDSNRNILWQKHPEFNATAIAVDPNFSP